MPRATFFPVLFASSAISMAAMVIASSKFDDWSGLPLVSGILAFLMVIAIAIFLELRIRRAVNRLSLWLIFVLCTLPAFGVFTYDSVSELIASHAAPAKYFVLFIDSQVPASITKLRIICPYNGDRRGIISFSASTQDIETLLKRGGFSEVSNGDSLAVRRADRKNYESMVGQAFQVYRKQISRDDSVELIVSSDRHRCALFWGANRSLGDQTTGSN